MIAQFWYDDAPCESHIAIRLDWEEGEPIACVEAPPHVTHRLSELSIPHREGSMRLPFALGYGVTIAALTEAKLTVTGDVTAWPVSWGDLTFRNAGSRFKQLSQAH